MSETPAANNHNIQGSTQETNSNQVSLVNVSCTVEGKSTLLFERTSW